MKPFVPVLALLLMITSSCNNGTGADTTQAVLDNIATRTSIRAYTDEPVSDADVETLLRAAMAAPSAMNRQPWEFVVLDNPDTLKSLAGKLRYAKMLEQAPLAIVVCAEKMLTLRDGTVVENNFWEHDASAAAENILLAAHALGLGAVWTAASDPQRAEIVREALCITGTVWPLCVIPVGHPAEAPAPKDKWKPEKIHRNRW